MVLLSLVTVGSSIKKQFIHFQEKGPGYKTMEVLYQRPDDVKKGRGCCFYKENRAMCKGRVANTRFSKYSLLMPAMFHIGQST